MTFFFLLFLIFIYKKEGFFTNKYLKRKEQKKWLII